MSDYQTPTVQNTVNHVISIDSTTFKQTLRSVTPSLLFGGTLAAMIKTNGEFKEINYSLVAFAGLCIFTSLFR